jgi:hypothetical protein
MLIGKCQVFVFLQEESIKFKNFNYWTNVVQTIKLLKVLSNYTLSPFTWWTHILKLKYDYKFDWRDMGYVPKKCTIVLVF